MAQRPLEGLLQVCAETVMMLVVARSRRSARSTCGRTCCGATAGEEAWVETVAQGVAAACSLMSSIHDQSEFLHCDESLCSRFRVDHSSRRQHSLIPSIHRALHPARGLLVHLRKRECSESCAEPSAVLAHSSYTALCMSICQVQSLHKCQVPIQIPNTKYHASGVSAHTLSRATGAAHALRALRAACAAGSSKRSRYLWTCRRAR
jgi:hypothetical protein